MVASTIVSVTLKRVIARPRPPVDAMTGAGNEESYSPPLGHTACDRRAARGPIPGSFPASILRTLPSSRLHGYRWYTNE